MVFYDIVFSLLWLMKAQGQRSKSEEVNQGVMRQVSSQLHVSQDNATLYVH